MFYPPKVVHRQEQSQNGGRAPQASPPGLLRQRWDSGRSHRPHRTLEGTKTRWWGLLQAASRCPAPTMDTSDRQSLGRQVFRAGSRCRSAGLGSPQVPAPPFWLLHCAVGGKITNYWGKTPLYPDSEKQGLRLRFSLNCKQLAPFPGCWNIWYICEIGEWLKTHPLGDFVSTY